uniref:C2-C2_1 domain-containing protein n=1 Tax=Parastrongyloides trichosuri TaxID=131310 RepID=A0A0N5A3D2_PARTI
MVGRPPIETWNRGELEDKFLKIYNSEFELKKKNKTLENELKKQNTKLRKKLAGEGPTSDSDHLLTIHTLKHEKEILNQKISALKQQLLAYTTPQMRQIGLNLLTSRPTNIATLRTMMTTGGRHSAKMIIGSDKIHGKIVDEMDVSQNDNIIKSSQLIDNKQKHIQNFSNFHVNIKDTPKQNKSFDKEPLDDNTIAPGSVEHIPNSERTIDSQLKVNYIKINRELRAKIDEINELKKHVETKSVMLNDLQKEMNNIVEENSILRKEKKQAAKTMKDLEKKIQINLGDFENSGESPRVTNSQDRNKIEMPILEAEIRQLKEEIDSLKEINEKLIKNSFEQKNSGKVKIDQLNSLKGTIETLNEKIDSYKKNNEELEKKIQYLTAEKQAMEKHLINKEHSSTDKTSNLELKAVLEELSQIRNTTTEVKKYGDDNIDNLFASINSMMVKYAEEDGLGDNKDFEYKKMYEELHEEVEKLRNLLVLQHDINEKQIEEIELLKMNNRLLSEELNKRKMIIEENNIKHNLEINKLKGQINKKYSLPQNIDVYPEPFSVVQPQDVHTVNEMLVILKGIQFNEKFNTNSQTVYFISLEFFNFEILITPTFSGVSCSFEYVAIYDLIVSELLVYYMQNEGVYIELYKVVGSEFEKIGTGLIKLNELVKTPKILDQDVLIINNNEELGRIRFSITLTDTIFECIKQGYKNLYFNGNVVTGKDIEVTNTKEVSKNKSKGIEINNKKVLENKKMEETKSNQVFSQKNIFPINEDKQFPNKKNSLTNLKEENTNELSSTSSVSSTKSSKESKVSSNNAKSIESNERISIIKEQDKASKEILKENSLQYIKEVKKNPETRVNVDIYCLSSLYNIVSNNSISTFVAYQIPGHSAFLSDPTEGINPIYNCHKEWDISLDDENINNLTKEGIFIYIVDAEKCSKTVPDSHIFDEAVICYSIVNVKDLDLNKSMYGDYPTYLGNGKISEAKLRLAIYIGDIKTEQDFFDKPLAFSVEIKNDVNKKNDDNSSGESNKSKGKLSKQSSTSSNETSSTKTYIKSESSIEGIEEIYNIDKSSIVKTKQSIKSTLPRQLAPLVPPRKSLQKVDSESPPPHTIIQTVAEIVSDNNTNSMLPLDSEESPKNSQSSSDKTGTTVEHIQNQSFIDKGESTNRSQTTNRSSILSEKSTGTRESKESSKKQYDERRGVGFTSPLHYSISPSNSMTSHTSIIEGENINKKEKLIKKKTPSLYDTEMMKNIKPISHSKVLEKISSEDMKEEAILTVNLYSFYTTDNLYYIYGGNINFNVFFEWQIIDIDQELCETKESIRLPRYPNLSITINSKNEYSLTKRQVELLEQWQELGNKMTFTMVLDPGDEGECDDIGTASFDLQYLGINRIMEIKMYSNDGDWIASLNVETNIRYI